MFFVNILVKVLFEKSKYNCIYKSEFMIILVIYWDRCASLLVVFSVLYSSLLPQKSKYDEMLKQYGNIH